MDYNLGLLPDRKSTTSQSLALQKSSFASPPTATVTLAAHPSATLLTNLFGSLIARPLQLAMPAGQSEQAPRVVVHLAAKLEPEVVNAYYVDSPSDKEGGAAAEAQVDFMMGDLELLYREQLASLEEDFAEYQAVKKWKAVVTDPSP